MDQTSGEISRAMRNRCVEIFFNGQESVQYHNEEFLLKVHHNLFEILLHYIFKK